MRTTLAALVALLALSACGTADGETAAAPERRTEPSETADVQPGAEPEPEPTETEPSGSSIYGKAETRSLGPVAGADVEDDEAELEISDEGDQATRTSEGRLMSVSEPPVLWEKGGVRLEVQGVTLSSVEAAEEDFPGIQAELDPATETLVLLTLTATNATGDTISWHPNQGTLVIGSEQVDASIWHSDDIGEVAWFDGVEMSGAVVFEFTSTFEELAPVGLARYIVTSAHSSDDYGVDYGGDAMMDIAWSPEGA